MSKTNLFSIVLLLGLLPNLFLFGQNTDVFQLGHSLVNHDMPSMLQSLCNDAGVNHTYEVGIINGAPLFWTWAHHDECAGKQATTVDAKVELASGNYEVFVMTEGVPWDPIINDFYKYTDSFHYQAIMGNPNVQTYLYETWNCINTGLPTGCMYDDGDTILWAQRIREDISTWEDVMDSLNTLYPTNEPVLIIPAGQAYANLKDSVEAGVVPGVSDFFGTFFEDDIHSSLTGKYFNALVHYACIYKQSPVGLTNQTTNEWGGDFPDVELNLAAKLQEIAWNTVVAYPYSGVGGPPPPPPPADDCAFDNDLSTVEVEGNICVSGSANISEVLKLKPLDDAPQNPEKGMMYFDNTTNKLRVYDGSSWQDCW